MGLKKYQQILGFLWQQSERTKLSVIEAHFQPCRPMLTKLRSVGWVDCVPELGWCITKRGMIACRKGYQLRAAMNGSLVASNPIFEKARHADYLKAAEAKKRRADARVKRKVKAMTSLNYFEPALSMTEKAAMALSESDHTLETLAAKFKESPSKVFSAILNLGSLVVCVDGVYTINSDVWRYLTGEASLMNLKAQIAEQRRQVESQRKQVLKLAIRETQEPEYPKRYQEVCLGEIRLPETRVKFVNGWAAL